jgi:hypothetical protein
VPRRAANDRRLDRVVLFGDASGAHCASRPRRDRDGPTFAQQSPNSSSYLLFGLFLRSNVENPSVHTRLRSHAPSRADCKVSNTLD